jgi:hypothetical protein
MAVKAQAEADAATLPNVRTLHLRSAVGLDEILSGLKRHRLQSRQTTKRNEAG